MQTSNMVTMHRKEKATDQVASLYGLFKVVLLVTLSLLFVVIFSARDKASAETELDLRIWAIDHTEMHEELGEYHDPFYNPSWGEAEANREQMGTQVEITDADGTRTETTPSNQVGSGGGGGDDYNPVRLDGLISQLNAAAPTQALNNYDQSVDLLGISFEDGSGNSVNVGQFLGSGDLTGLEDAINQLVSETGSNQFRLLFHYTDCTGVNPPEICQYKVDDGGDPEIRDCLDGALRTISFSSSSSSPPRYGSYGNTVTRESTVDFDYHGVEDTSPGRGDVAPTETNIRSGSVTLDFGPPVAAYPYDQNQGTISYTRNYQDVTYRATGSEVWSYRWETDTECEWVRVITPDGARWEWRCTETRERVRDRLLGYRYVETSRTGILSEDRENSAGVPPCLTRDFNASARAHNVSLSPDYESPNEYNASGGFSVFYSPPSSALRVNSSAAISCTMRIYIDRHTGSDQTLQNTACSGSSTQGSPSSPSGASGPINVPGNMQVGDRVCVTVSVSPANGELLGPSNMVSSSGSSTQSACSSAVENWPYSKIFGGDVVTGGGFGTCSLGGVVRGRNTLPSAGTSTQYAIFAANQVSGFSSAGLRDPSSSEPIPRKGLTFANDDSSLDYGGNFDSMLDMSCLPDYFGSDIYENAESVSGLGNIRNRIAEPNDSPEEVEYLEASGNMTNFPPAGLEISNSSRKVLFVDGDITINRNITYDDSGWSDRDEVPYFMLVARNIYIAPGVTQLDGVYVAQGDDSSAGRLVTCQADNIFNDCQNPLVINGSIVAEDIELTRTRGSLSNANVNEGREGQNPFNVGGCRWTSDASDAGTLGGGSCAAEIISFSPEMYLAISQLLVPEESFDYDSYTILPPNL